MEESTLRWLTDKEYQEMEEVFSIGEVPHTEKSGNTSPKLMFLLDTCKRLGLSGYPRIPVGLHPHNTQTPNGGGCKVIGDPWVCVGTDCVQKTGGVDGPMRFLSHVS